MTLQIVSKARTQIDDLVYSRGNLRRNLGIILSIANRRGMPIPSVLHADASINVDGEISFDMGDENFLIPYMIPKRNECFVDIGASIGGWTFFVAKKGIEVYAFEPSPKAYRVLKSRAERYSTVHPFSCALGDQDTTGRLCTSAVNVSGTMDQEISCPGGGTIDIAVRKLDSLSLLNVGIIKVDTEGYETPILRGAKETIKKYKPRLIIEVHKASGKAADTFAKELQRVETILDSYNYSWILRHRQVSLRGEMQPFIIAHST